MGHRPSHHLVHTPYHHRHAGKGFLGKLLVNAEISAHLEKHHGDLAAEIKKVVESVDADISALPME